MIPTINITPHSPASKYNNIFEDTLVQLQNIRENVAQMKNSRITIQEQLSNYSLFSLVRSASLPDISSGGDATHNSIYNSTHPAIWSPQYTFLNTDHKFWPTNNELSTNGGNKSISLSSLDSEEQETVRVVEQRRRPARNSTGGISSQSLNEAELVRDFERIAGKRSLASEILNRVPLQKSVSTSSIIAKDDKAISRHLTDSEDENQTLLRTHTKIEVYDNAEKRRKRGSLFFRKKKDKNKVKGQLISCDSCGVIVPLSTNKGHQQECKSRKQNIKTTATKKCSDNKLERGQEYYDGAGQHNNFSDVTPLIQSEFLVDPSIMTEDLGADPLLGITSKEYDSWSPGVPKDILKTLSEKQIKRQEHIYEFIMTEKHHCQTLLVMQKIFAESLEMHFPSININKMFPRLAELSELHLDFLQKLRERQKENYIVDSISDILVDFFSANKANCLRLAYGEFCANHRTALEQFKYCMTNGDQTFAEWYKHCLSNPLLKKKGIPECILFVTQRLTKYPLLIEPLLKSAGDNKSEAEQLQRGLNMVKSLLVDVDACVAEKELVERQIDIFNRVDIKSFAIYKNKPFRKGDLGIGSHRRLKFEGLATLLQGRSKMQLVLVVVLTDCLCFLCENSAHNKYTFFTPEHKSGVVPLQKLLIREKAGTESRGIYIISSNPSFPEMYELKVQQPKDKNIWIQSIRQAVLDCPTSDLFEAVEQSGDEKLKIGANKMELIEKMRQKDIEQAILLEEKIILQLNLLREENKSNESTGSSVSASNFLHVFGSYRDLVDADCNTSELWKRVLNTVQEISTLATSVYTAATGLPVSRSVSSAGEKHSETYASPTLPKRAETFAGFDERRSKNVYPCVTKLAALQMMTPRLHELEEKKENRTANPSQQCSQSFKIGHSDNDDINCFNNLSLKDHNFTALQVTHHLHTLLCIISQQMTTINNLQLQLVLYRDGPTRTVYPHNDQLEELRNLQDKLQEEKLSWQKQREQQEAELNERRAEQESLRKHIKAEQEDIRQQREQLYRKMELLSNQGLLLSPNTPLMITNQTLSGAAGNDDMHENGLATNENQNVNPIPNPNPVNIFSDISNSGSSFVSDRRKDKWRTASTISKTPPDNLLSATNAPKVNHNSIKQKIPMKLSSFSSTNTSKIDKSASFNYSSTSAAATAAMAPSHSCITPLSSGVTQMLPLKLADKRSTSVTAQVTPQHSRTGSSPAIIQHPPASSTPLSSIAVATSRSVDISVATTVVYGEKSNLVQVGKQSPDKYPASTSINISATTNSTTDEEEIYF